MDPFLPRHDPRPERRQRGLERARERYEYDYDYHGIVAVKSLPLADKADLSWWKAVVEKIVQLEVNKAAASRSGDKPETLRARIRDRLGGLVPEKLVRARKAREVGHAPTAEQGLGVYDRLYTTLDRPPIVDRWQGDDVFAWQAVAGCNPYMIRRFDRPMPNFPVTDAIVAQALGSGATVSSAIGEGRLYVADYGMLDGLPEGELDGRPKVNFAPIALYGVRDGALVPVGIQTGQTPSRIFTPADGMSWRMARTTVSTAEGNWQGVLSHFALCHQVMESVILSARRQLAENHPLRILLEPHFDNTLITNDIAMSNLIGPDGYMERLQSPTLAASLDLANRGIAAFRIGSSSPAEDMASRGVADLDLLPEYPARDDGLDVWGALEPFVRDYVRLYYRSDADVAEDMELKGWIEELGSWDGGRLQGLEVPTTVDGVCGLLSRILFRCTSYHASINYPSFPLFSYPPNVQVAAFAPGPTGTASDTEQAWLDMLPPYDVATQGLALFWEITVQLNRIGEYDRGCFSDARVLPLVDRLQAALAAVEERIEQRNRGRLMPYPWQLPSRISRSIHV